MNHNQRLLKSSEVAEILGVSPSMLCRWRASLKGPPFIDLEGNPRYRSDAVEAWLDQQTRQREVA